MAQTLTQKLVAYLLSKGFVEVPSTSSKYRKFQSPTFQSPTGPRSEFYFVGRSGAVRVGKNSSTSHSVTDSVRRQLEREGFGVEKTADELLNELE